VPFLFLLGGIQSRYLEALAMIWILEYFNTKNGHHAFKLLRKEGRGLPCPPAACEDRGSSSWAAISAGCCSSSR
jgi:hypothetical protein